MLKSLRTNLGCLQLSYAHTQAVSVYNSLGACFFSRSFWQLFHSWSWKESSVGANECVPPRLALLQGGAGTGAAAEPARVMHARVYRRLCVHMWNRVIGVMWAGTSTHALATALPESCSSSERAPQLPARVVWSSAEQLTRCAAGVVCFCRAGPWGQSQALIISIWLLSLLTATRFTGVGGVGGCLVFCCLFFLRTGRSVSGNVQRQLVLCLSGGGAEGKISLVEAWGRQISAVLGVFPKNIDSETFCDKVIYLRLLFADKYMFIKLI